MLAPFLLVGVGGSGGKTLRAVRQELQLRLREVDWEGPFPSCWQLVHIDVPVRQDGTQDISQLLPAQDFCGLVEPDINYVNIDKVLRGKFNGPAGLEAVGGWRPDPDKVSVTISDGAGQFRALGRMVSLAYALRIRQYLEVVVKRLASTDIEPELRQLGRKFGAAIDGKAPKPVAMVISSIAGGTGAGMALDVCDLLRASGDLWASESIGIFYTPDVFNGIPSGARAGVNANALGTLMETLNAFWSQGHLSTDERNVLGIPADQARRGAMFPLLVGSENTGGVQFKEQVEVYRAAAKGLSALMVSEGLQDNVVAYVKTNIWPLSVGMQDTLPIKGGVAGNSLLPFCALGFARVSLGRDLFGQYARERLSRLAVDRLLREHLNAVPEEDRTIPDQAVKVLVDQHFDRFVKALGLWAERSPGDKVAGVNQLVETLRPRAEVIGLATANARDVDARMQQDSRDRPAAKWLDEISAWVRHRHDDWVREQQDARTKRLAAWSQDIQGHLAEVTAWYAAAFGLRVAQALVVRLGDYVQALARDMEAEEPTFIAWSRGMSADAQQALAVQGGIKSNFPGVAKASQKLIEGIVCEVDADTRKLVARVLDDMRQNLIVPLAASVGDSMVGLQNEEDSPDSVIKRWPSNDDEPSSLSPGKTEFLVESVSTYPRRFLELVQATAGDGIQPETALRLGVRQILAQATPRRRINAEPPTWAAGRDGDGQVADPQQMISFDPVWEPAELGIGSRARPSVACRAADISDRAESWLFENQFPFEQFLREDLQHYVQSPNLLESVRNEREKAFTDAFAMAARAASPLIGIDHASVAIAHPSADRGTGVTYQFSRIPFGRTSTVGQFVEDYVVSNKLVEGANTDSTLNDMLSADGRPVHRVDLFSTLSQPYHAVVFDSITKPILEEWTQRNVSDQSGDQLRAFWQWRRTRSLVETIPATREAMEAMTRGWFTAALLGQTQVEAFDDPRNVAVSVYDPDARAFVRFPTPFLECDPTDRRSLVPALLLNLGIAVISYSESQGVFAPYQRLLTLGRPGGNGKALNIEMNQFITSGTLAPGAPAVDFGSDQASRQTSVIERLRKSQDNYRRLDDKDEQPRLDEDVTSQWELRAMMIAAHETLLDQINKLSMLDDTL